MEDDGRDVRLPEREHGPLRVLLRRLGIATLLVLVVSAITVSVAVYFPFVV